ncbi:MAG: hypothetical protein ACREAC_31215, partial [Blastocatellia bacterium]
MSQSILNELVLKLMLSSRLIKRRPRVCGERKLVDSVMTHIRSVSVGDRRGAAARQWRARLVGLFVLDTDHLS